VFGIRVNDFEDSMWKNVGVGPAAFLPRWNVSVHRE
jgi:hypothetical protein